MKDHAPRASDRTVRLEEYAPFPWIVGDVSLTFRLHPTATRVLSRITFAPNPAAPSGPFFLHGEKLKLIEASIDGAPVSPTITDEGLTCDVPGTPFVFEAEVEIDPSGNTALDGLYMSGGMYCTQCEAEGFRKITFYPDRPDVMAPFNVRIEGPEDAPLPVMLSNGNPGAQEGNSAEWHDPWPKPSYLFALVAGDLVAKSGTFTTASGMPVALNVYVRPGDEDRCDYALDSLIRSMRWDEQEYAREYDLSVFSIVAVDDFNMGAMENKGLNIFNSKYVLASPDTATDVDFEMIEGIVAHEYFHNWTGNRVTCRDWFQLCLKEGLTVFRDQQFSGDMRSEPVKRIDDVLALRARQFREDNGPLAHPVRPESYIEINNFYTATVYEKGAEVIGMLRRLVGAEAYRAALDLYFERHDGQACTIEDWLKVFEDATGRDLSQFKLWYSQAGTPRVEVSEEWDEEAGRLALTFRQHTPPTPGQPDKAPLVIPIALGLLDAGGNEIMATEVVELTEAEQRVEIGLGTGDADLASDAPRVPGRPVPSILRGFSAPVILQRQTSAEERAFLLAHDTDPFNKWEAGRALARDVLVRMVTEGAEADPHYLSALEMVAKDDALDPAFRALALSLPSQDDLAQAIHDGGATPEPTAIWAALRRLAEEIGGTLEPVLSRLYDEMRVPGPYTPDAESAGARALRGAALAYLSRVDGGSRAAAQFAEAGNMTEQLGALGALLRIGKGEEELAAFRRRWEGDRLVMDKWFALQAASASPAEAHDVALRLTGDPAFDWTNPNRFRSVIGALTGNVAAFHEPEGRIYRLVTDWLIRLDPVNPQTAARLTTAFETWKRFDADRQGMIRENLERLSAVDGLSRDTSEMVGRILA
ncbi:aminopeptidase N [Tropicimonas sp. IMCC34011]|uniref:aminopeptidase N n=1 Tax=Tropicimonas sp. IMCC34011 TaxID=2248759 RepID=UPI000E260D77|nr:aminopeptidase N [Tropicimonas sp. IMCC34011]